MKQFHPVRILISTLLLSCVFNVYAQDKVENSPKVKKQLFSGLNDMQFRGQEEQRFLGSGFVLEYEGRYYGVTAKHVLLMSKSGPPANTDIQAQLAHWTLRNPRSDRNSKPIRFGKLLNGDPKEAVTPKVLDSDILLFELENGGDFQAIRLADKDPKPGDILRSIGCTFATEKACDQDVYAGVFIERKGGNLLIDVGKIKLQSLFGLSGAPVLNQNNELVGIVSQFLPDSSGKERNAPVDTSYLRALLRKYAGS